MALLPSRRIALRRLHGSHPPLKELGMSPGKQANETPPTTSIARCIGAIRKKPTLRALLSAATAQAAGALAEPSLYNALSRLPSSLSPPLNVELSLQRSPYAP